MEEFLDPQETAREVHKKPQTLAYWRCSRVVDLPYYKIGGRILYKKRDVLAFIERNKHNSEAR
jgi:hypothetical protein